ncbi:MAG TPA: YdeI/OmpD-associated family protein [Polyangiales bacterium]|nr:YdeI/OmpD-associated family protein [Polyangiales bacterium]
MASAKPSISNAKFFASPAAFRSWLVEHHDVETELVVGFYKVDSGKPSMTWSESVDEALCFGWIDGVRRSLGPDAYTIRFTRRRPKSFWSAINVAKIEKLQAAGKMYPAGEHAFSLRTAERTAVYSFERAEEALLTADEQRHFKRDKKAWAFFVAQAPSYKRIALHWVITAKRAETRTRRLEKLVEDSGAGRRLAHLTPAPRTKAARSPKRRSR